MNRLCVFDIRLLLLHINLGQRRPDFRLAPLHQLFAPPNSCSRLRPNALPTPHPHPIRSVRRRLRNCVHLRDRPADPIARVPRCLLLLCNAGARPRQRDEAPAVPVVRPPPRSAVTAVSECVPVCVCVRVRPFPRQNGGPGGGAGRRQLPYGHGEEQVHAGGEGEQEDRAAGSEVNEPRAARGGGGAAAVFFCFFFLVSGRVRRSARNRCPDRCWRRSQTGLTCAVTEVRLGSLGLDGSGAAFRFAVAVRDCPTIITEKLRLFS